MNTGESNASSDEIDRRNLVIERVKDHIRRNQTIRLRDAAEFSGSLGDLRYRIEGEDDLLHVIVTRADSGAITPEEARPAIGFVFQGVPPGVIWLKPGEFSQHFYIGHDELLAC
jgi:hypothetical protein